MQNITKSILLALLLVPFVAVTSATEAVSEKKTVEIVEAAIMSLPTDNGSIMVEVIIENARVEHNQFTIDQPQVVTFNLRFLDPVFDEPLEHVNFKFMITDEDGNIVHKINENHTHDGEHSYSLLFPDTGLFTLTLDVAGLGGPPPYDTTFSGTVISSVTVTPEFPLGVMAIMAAVVGIAIAATRLKNPLMMKL